MRLVTNSNQYTFAVSGDLNKIEIAQKVSQEYDVPVSKVRTQIRPGKTRRNPITRTLGRRPAKKIAYVTLPEGKGIPEFEEELEEE